MYILYTKFIRYTKFIKGDTIGMKKEAKIREMLGEDTKNPKFIKTVWGVGYKWVG